MRCVTHEYFIVYIARMNSTLNGSSALQHFKCSNAIEIRNGIMFDFYPGLPHITVKKKTRCSPIVQDKFTNTRLH